MGTPSRTEPTRTLGKYSLFEKLGEGSLGPVYRGFDQELGRAVAIRILSDGIKWDAEIEELFFRECRSVAGLQHPSIAAIYEVGKEAQSPYIVVESLGSNSLESLIAQKPAMTVESKLSIMIRIADALNHAHKHGILHGNLEPAKIHLTADGSIKVRDFAIVQALLNHLPRPGVRPGAPLYLSPEQREHKNGDARSDIFSAGMIFYELLTYSHPFSDPNISKTPDNIPLDAELPTFERFPDEPPAVWPILRTCLARDPKDRYQTMESVLTACKELLKDVADDARFMLAELHASLDPLRRAAARVDASVGTVRLLQDAKRFLSGEEQADYVSLDRLMTGLIEQYPVIQEAAGELQKLEAERLQFPSKVMGVASVTEGAALPLEPAIGGTGVSPQEQIAPTAIACENPVQEADSPVAPFAANLPREPVGDRPVAVEAYLEETTQPEQPFQVESAGEEPYPVEETTAPQDSRWIFRFAVASLSVLIIAVAVFIALEIGTAASMRRSQANRGPEAQIPAKVSAPLPGSQKTGNGPASGAENQEAADQNTVSILLKEACSFAGMNRFEEGKVLLRRILEIDPACEEAGIALKEIEESSGGNRGSETDQALQKQFARVSNLIGSGKLIPAKTELDRLQKAYPNSPELKALRQRWQARNSREAQEQARRQEEQQKVMRRQKEEEWNRKTAQLFALGKYNEAGNVASSWLAEDPGNSRARDFSGKIQEIQRYLKAYASASSENRYQDALNALGSAEKMNPEDSSFAELRRQTEAKKAAAKAVLTVYRLGAKGTLLLDGKPIGSDGEVTNETIPIGNHTLAIETDGRPLMSRSQEYAEGQGVVLVYDLSRQHLRAMAETDKELLAQRRTRESVHRFTLEHAHGRLRGSCSGVLAVSYSEVAYNPFKGSHGFRMPFNTLKIRGDGKSIDLLFASGDTQVQSFKFLDVQTAERFKQTWNELKALAR
jgi:hypothetical protein